MTFPAHHSVLAKFTGYNPDEEIFGAWIAYGVIASRGETNRLWSGDQITVGADKKGRPKIVSTDTYPTHQIVSCHCAYIKVKDLVSGEESKVDLYL